MNKEHPTPPNEERFASVTPFCTVSLRWHRGRLRRATRDGSSLTRADTHTTLVKETSDGPRCRRSEIAL